MSTVEFTYKCTAKKSHTTKTTGELEVCPECSKLVYVFKVSVKLSK